MTVDQIVGERFAIVMFRKGLSQTKLAPRLGITQTALSKKLHGERPWTLEELLTMASILDMPVEEVLAELPHMDSNHEPCGFWVAGVPTAPLASLARVAA